MHQRWEVPRWYIRSEILFLAFWGAVGIWVSVERGEFELLQVRVVAHFVLSVTVAMVYELVSDPKVDICSHEGYLYSWILGVGVGFFNDLPMVVSHYMHSPKTELDVWWVETIMVTWAMASSAVGILLSVAIYTEARARSSCALPPRRYQPVTAYPTQYHPMVVVTPR
jgi:hypothetical protein